MASISGRLSRFSTKAFSSITPKAPATNTGWKAVATNPGSMQAKNAKPAFSEHLAAQKDYQANRHQLGDADAAEIDSRWQEYAKRYGYDRD